MLRAQPPAASRRSNAYEAAPEEGGARPEGESDSESYVNSGPNGDYAHAHALAIDCRARGPVDPIDGHPLVGRHLRDDSDGVLRTGIAELRRDARSVIQNAAR